MSTSETPEGGSPELPELVGALFADRFRVLRTMSEGANTHILDAIDEQSGRTVTLKLVQPKLSSSPSFRARFDETMRAAGALSHPNVAAVFDWGIAPIGDTSTAYVVIEQLTGGSLRDMFDRGRRLSPSQALAVGLDACRGLDYAHRRGMAHTELTPSKLVFGDDRRLRIIDFGLARLLGEGAWERPDAVPNHVAWYAAPEQGQGGAIDGKADVYALCLALHEAVTGELPFRDDSTVASLAARQGRLMPVSADLGPLAAVLERAGRPDPEDRATAAEFGQALVGAATKLPRPEPLPLLSTGLFETPAERLRTPDDPTGGVVRPANDPDAARETGPDTGARIGADIGPVPDPPVIVEAEPDAVVPSVDPGDELVILPIDSGLGDGGTSEAPVATTRPSGARSVVETQQMHVAAREAAPHRRRPRFPWKIVLGLLVIAALAVLGVLATQLFRTPVYRVPDLVTMPEAEARNLIAPNGWEVTLERERSDQVPEVGRVVRSAPSAGVDLAEGEPFLLVVSDGPTLRELPDSAGVRLSEAETRLRERGLGVSVVEAFDETVPPDTVISWSVPGDPTLTTGSMVAPETIVELVVSAGPELRVVPDVVGELVGAARDRLGEIGLALDDTDQVFSDDVPLGTIISQGLDPGTEVERGTTIAVIVSQGPDLVTFPDLSGASTYEEAAEILRDAGFEPVLVFGDAGGALRSVEIDGSQPEVGTTHRRGTRVDIEAI